MPAAITRMKRIVTATGFVLLFVPSIFARARVANVPREQSVLARVTVYWASGGRGSDSYTRQHKSATGVRLRSGHCAVDPRQIPYGSKVVLSDGVFTAVDTGSALVSRKAARRAGRTPSERNAIVIDRFFETKRQALSWANTHPAFMTVQVIPPNSRSATLPRPQVKPPAQRLWKRQASQPDSRSSPNVVAEISPQNKRIVRENPSVRPDRVRR